jgi:hypothetical protein
VAIADFIPKGPAELELKVGDVIKVTKRMPKRWIGTLNGKVGSFPPECVQIKDEPNVSAPPPSLVTPSSGRVAGRGRGRGSGGLYNTLGRHSSYIPDKNDTPKTSAGEIISSQSVRPKSNYTTAEELGSSQKEQLEPKPLGGKGFQLPPPPAALVERRASPSGLNKSTNTAGSGIKFPPPVNQIKLPPPPSSINIPKFGDVVMSEEDSEPIPPARSPPCSPRPENLPPLPYRDPLPDSEQEAPNGESADPAPKKRTKEDLRQACLQEIYQTEKDYIIDLENIISV